MGILIFTWPANHPVVESLDMCKRNHDKQNKQRGSHSRTHDLHRTARQPIPNLNRRDGESHIWENISIPVEMEIIAMNGFKRSNDRDGEEPECQHPEEDGGEERADLHDIVDDCRVGDAG